MGKFMNYKIEIKDTLSRMIDIEADNEEGIYTIPFILSMASFFCSGIT